MLCSCDLVRLLPLILLVLCVTALSYNYIFQVKVEKGNLFDNNARAIQMGINPDCDDGKINLTVDWDHSPTVYTCTGKTVLPDPVLVPEYYCETIPKNYKAEHKCMSETIVYSKPIPTYGTHRSVWPVYGEYKYLPVQRCLHSLKHGAIVVLYHPCAGTSEVYILKKLVKKCFRRYIISPSNLLDEKKPLALLSWGCRITMSYVIEETVNVSFEDMLYMAQK